MNEIPATNEVNSQKQLSMERLVVQVKGKRSRGLFPTLWTDLIKMMRETRGTSTKTIHLHLRNLHGSDKRVTTTKSSIENKGDHFVC